MKVYKGKKLLNWITITFFKKNYIFAREKATYSSARPYLAPFSSCYTLYEWQSSWKIFFLQPSSTVYGLINVEKHFYYALWENPQFFDFFFFFFLIILANCAFSRLFQMIFASFWIPAPFSQDCCLHFNTSYIMDAIIFRSWIFFYLGAVFKYTLLSVSIFFQVRESQFFSALLNGASAFV